MQPQRVFERSYAALHHYMQRPGDTVRDAQIRSIVFPVALCAPIVVFHAVTIAWVSTGFYFVGIALCACVLSLWLAVFLLRVVCEYARLMALSSLVMTVGVLLCDIQLAATLEGRAWPGVILIMDILLLVECDRWVPCSVIVTTVTVLTAITLEDTIQYGLNDVVHGLMDDHGDRCSSCADPPCPLPPRDTWVGWVLICAIYFSDYNVTRRFALGLRQQLEVNDATVVVAERVSSLSADYAIADARRVVDEQGGMLSQPLRNSYLRLLGNLERYRAFLPAGILLTENSAGADAGSGAHGPGERASQRLLPQLDSELSRNAAQCILAQATGQQRALAEAFMAERLETCINAEDVRSAQSLLQLGWDPPAPLARRLRELPAAAAELNPAASFDLRETSRSLLNTPSTAMLRPLAVQRLSTNSFTSVSTAATPADLGASAANRFSDGAANPAAAVATTVLWPPEYVAPSPSEAVRKLAQWHSPKGDTYWPGDAVRRIISDFDLFYRDACGPGRQMIALYLYTAEINECVIWAAWAAQGQRWKLYPNQDARAKGGTVQVDTDEARAAGVTFASSSVELLLQSPWGMQFYGRPGEPCLLRYENSMKGDPEASPMHDTVMWAPHPRTITSTENVFSYARPGEPPPPPGVLEYVTSRDFRTACRHRDWETSPVAQDRFSKLYESCMAQKNQQRPKEKLCQFAKDMFFPVQVSELQGTGIDDVDLFCSALPVAYRAKCPGDSPTPAQIAHACELGLLRWRGTQILAAFTGEPRVAVPLKPQGLPRAEVLSRANLAFASGQPYLLMNGAMRREQGGRRDAALRVAGHRELFTARQPAEAPAEPSPALFQAPDAGVTAQWAGSGWAVSVASRPVVIEHQEELDDNAWGLPQYRAIIWHIDVGLQGLPEIEGRRKGYRGLYNVLLDRSIYSRGKVVVFTAFTSTSDDQGVASSFAQVDGSAVVFTMYNSTGRYISPWSRYCREKEVLLPPNTLHLVTEALSAEHAAIVNKETLQVFDLREVTMAEAVRHLAKEGALDISREYPSVLHQAELCAAAAERADWVGALRELLVAPSDRISSTGDGRFVRSIMPHHDVGVIALVLSSPAGPELGAGIEVGLWNDFFERAEKCAAPRGAHVIATPLGHIMVQVIQDCAENTARTAVALAEELLDAADPDARDEAELALSTSRRSPSSSPRRSMSPGGLSRGASMFSPAAAARARARRIVVGASTAASSSASSRKLQVNCGVSVGTVHSGFGGSAQRRVEIADGPAVRRAFRMAAYSRRYAIREIVTDAACAGPAHRAGYVSWTVDLVSFDSERDMREPLTCVEPRPRPGSSINTISWASEAAQRVQEAWQAVTAMASTGATGGGVTALQHVRDAVAALPRSITNHRTARALQDAAAKPATYCLDLEGLT